eukprot:TRINITY_DN793_c0_g1_i1.p1 TRINITY_DN793_c0_g1~~TRINITY_DN793_c0_g1_i1.p1  ORF type:complete len:207 (-),score=-58.59 TRINITY_DN793_c0_g1_i1:5-625(-)
MVSDSFHSLLKGSFHLSLTVLVHYRSPESIQPYEMVLADSHRIPLTPWYLGLAHKEPSCFRLQGFHLLWRVFPNASTNTTVFYSSIARQFDLVHPTTPTSQRLSPSMMLGLGSSPFARHYSGNHYYFLFQEVLRCFSSLRLPCIPMDSVCSIPTLLGMGFPIRTPPGQRPLPSHRGFSQVTASFFAFWCQGIHHMPFCILLPCTLR